MEEKKIPTNVKCYGNSDSKNKEQLRKGIKKINKKIEIKEIN